MVEVVTWKLVCFPGGQLDARRQVLVLGLQRFSCWVGCWRLKEGSRMEIDLDEGLGFAPPCNSVALWNFSSH